ncbi:hypothetical protein SDC9_166668 [bioreactor metagenome]|uniref:Uncharacterized protein n=1 Tax=bioreactor metagenome TaxID=1076179 RepID=A0A645FXL3_9ZZZZ
MFDYGKPLLLCSLSEGHKYAAQVNGSILDCFNNGRAGIQLHKFNCRKVDPLFLQVHSQRDIAALQTGNTDSFALKSLLCQLLELIRTFRKRKQRGALRHLSADDNNIIALVYVVQHSGCACRGCVQLIGDQRSQILRIGIVGGKLHIQAFLRIKSGFRGQYREKMGNSITPRRHSQLDWFCRLWRFAAIL